MPLRKPLHITPQGGSILCLEGLTGRIFRACSVNKCTYTGNLHSAKSFLDFIENKTNKFLPSGKKNEKIPSQRKTTLKWNSDGSLSSEGRLLDVRLLDVHRTRTSVVRGLTDVRRPRTFVCRTSDGCPTPV